MPYGLAHVPSSTFRRVKWRSNSLHSAVVGSRYSSLGLSASAGDEPRVVPDDIVVVDGYVRLRCVQVLVAEQFRGDVNGQAGGYCFGGEDVAQSVRCDCLALRGRVVLCGSGGMLGDQPCDGAARERGSGVGAKQRRDTERPLQPEGVGCHCQDGGESESRGERCGSAHYRVRPRAVVAERK